MGEAQKPIPVAPPRGAGFWIRCLIDHQLLTIVRFLRPRLTGVHGSLLDVGAGEAPWRTFLPEGIGYTGLDIEHADDFGMTPNVPDVVSYPGGPLHFPAA